MKNLRRLALGLLAGVVAGLVVTVGPVEATIAEEVPLGSGDFSAADEGYVKIGKHFTKGHVDMNIGSVRLCGHFPLGSRSGRIVRRPARAIPQSCHGALSRQLPLRVMARHVR